MITKKRSAIVSSSFGLYCVGLGLVLGGIVVGLNWYDKAVRQSHADPTELEQRAPAGREAKDATWTVHIQTVDKALAQKNIGLAERAWRDAHAAALRSGRWDGLVEVGDAYLRLGEAAGYRKASEARTRGTYWAALLRARQQDSPDGMLRMAEAFAALGDREVAAQCVHIAEGLATRSRNAQAHDHVRAFRERLAAQGSGVKHLDADPF